MNKCADFFFFKKYIYVELMAIYYNVIEVILQHLTFLQKCNF